MLLIGSIPFLSLATLEAEVNTTANPKPRPATRDALPAQGLNARLWHGAGR
jgi:hypothetical protein